MSETNHRSAKRASCSSRQWTRHPHLRRPEIMQRQWRSITPIWIDKTSPGVSSKSPKSRISVRPTSPVALRSIRGCSEGIGFKSSAPVNPIAAAGGKVSRNSNPRIKRPAEHESSRSGGCAVLENVPPTLRACLGTFSRGAPSGMASRRSAPQPPRRPSSRPEVADVIRKGRAVHATAGRRAGAEARQAPNATAGRCNVEPNPGDAAGFESIRTHDSCARHDFHESIRTHDSGARYLSDRAPNPSERMIQVPGTFPGGWLPYEDCWKGEFVSAPCRSICDH
jgi:hypothetical protein